MTGIFLFTKDDELHQPDKVIFAPRDNVVLEAGYFLKAKGHARTIIILEKGAKWPSDLHGLLYVHLEDRNELQSIQNSLNSLSNIL